MKKTVHFQETIHAPKSKVWDTMLNDETYREWTSEFTEGSYYEGDWQKGHEIRFFAPNKDGMISRVAENRNHEFISLEHIGQLKKGVEDYSSDEVKSWTPAFENYTFSEKNGVTKVDVSMDVTEDFEKYMLKTWPKALAKLKTMCEMN